MGPRSLDEDLRELRREIDELRRDVNRLTEILDDPDRLARYLTCLLEERNGEIESGETDPPLVRSSRN